MMNILSIIPARYGSKGVKKKNIKLLNGKPLIYYTIKESLKSKFINKTIVSTDNSEIQNISLEYGAECPFLRPKKISGDNIPMIPVVMHVIKKLKEVDNYTPDYIIILQPTSPLRNYNHIDECIKKLITKKAHSIVSVTKIPHTFTPYSSMTLQKNGFLKSNYNTNEKNNLRQMKPTFYSRNGAIYMVKHKTLMTRNSLYGSKILPYEMEKNVSIDIDDEIDFLMAEVLLKRKELNVK